MNKNFLLAILCTSMLGMVSGCSILTPQLHVEKIDVPVLIPCNIVPPKKPVMPFTDATDNLDDVYVLTQRTLAEIERRKGYETELEAAITGCNSK